MTKEQDDAGGTAGSTISAVSALMEERRRFESWITALDQKRDSTPEHVFTRVHADYQGRLDAVVAKLATHADGLRQEIGALTARLSAVRHEHQQATDERAEAELRAHVGELTTDEWNTLAAESDAKLHELAARGDEVALELGRTRELLENAERPTPAPSSPRVSQSASAPSAVAAEEPFVPLAPPAVSDTAEAGAHVPSAAPRSSLSVQAPPNTAASPDAARSAAPAAQPAASNGFDELSFLRSVVDAPMGAPVEPSPRDEPDEASKVDSFARRSREESVQRLTGDQPLIMRSSGEELSRDSQPLVYQRTPGSALDPVKDPAIEGTKTLRCGECGALNYPTEWYCERCGAELASL